jgi:hypothetical protein
MNFLKALPFASVTRHLPAIAEFAEIWRTKFREQLKLGYILLKALDTCEQIMDIPCLFFDGLRSTLAAVDSFCPSGNAYQRLNLFVRRVIQIHNALILGPEPEFVPFRWIQSKFMMSGMNIENILLPAVVFEWEHGFGDSFDPLTLLMKSVSVLSRRAESDHIPAVFTADDRSRDIMYRKISFYGECDFMGFTEADFLNSFSFALERPANPGLELLRYSLLNDDPDPSILEDVSGANLPKWSVALICCTDDSSTTIIEDLMNLKGHHRKYFMQFRANRDHWEYHGINWVWLRDFLTRLRDDKMRLEQT